MQLKRLSIKEQKDIYRKANKEYFEAILQLRELTEEQFNEIFDYIEGSYCRISKHIIHKNGVDLYLTSQKFIQQLSRWIKARFNCQLSTTSTLHTRDTKASKDLYRLTVHCVFLTFKVGDVIDYEGEKVKITTLGQKASGRVLSTGQRIFIDPKVLNKKPSNEEENI